MKKHMVSFGMKYISGEKRLIQGEGVREMRGSACFEGFCLF